MQNNEIPLYVTDTHSLIWYLTDSPKLSLNASKGFKEIEEDKAKLLIPAIVVAEIIYIVERGKVKLIWMIFLKKLKRQRISRFLPSE